jgi:predicted site-specific integrase-resolvase
VATKHDLQEQSERLTMAIQASADRVRADLANQMSSQTRAMIFSLLAAVFTVTSVVGSLAFAIR